jgi:arylsulfatase
MGIGWSDIKDDGAKSALSYVRDTHFGEQEFLFINLMEAHGPYKPPKNYRSTEEPEFDKALATVQGLDVSSDQVKTAYNDSVRYLSDIYKDIFVELENSFDIVITVADHGELFGEHGSWGHLYGVFPELVHVPMVISGKGFSGTTTKTVSLMDIYATILDVAKISSDRRARSVVDSISERDALTEFHGLQPDKREKLRKAEIPDEKIQRYNESLNGIGFSSGYYGWETLDGFDEQGDPGSRDPLSVLDDVRSSFKQQKVERKKELSNAVESQLEELGYM